MSLSVKLLNGDTSFYLTFSPGFAGDQPKDSVPGSFTILIDPWLSGPSKIWASWFSITHHTFPACIESLADIPPPDLVIVSQDKSDHCHKETLLQLPPDEDAMILGTKAAVKKIRSWEHFDPDTVQCLPIYDSANEDSVFRVTIPPFSPGGLEGEVTISLLAPKKFDVTGLHNAIGITYRAPSSALTNSAQILRKLPSLPPTTNVATAQGLRPSTPSPASTQSSSVPYDHGREKTISAIYSPHGVDYNLVESYASNHLLNESALPLSVLMHSFNRSSNPWWMGGNICAGSPGGMTIARNLFARTWISAHDEEKITKGLGASQLKVEKHSVSDIKDELQSIDSGIGMIDKCGTTELVSLGPGQAYIVAPK